MKKKYFFPFLALFAFKAQAQFTFLGQLRTRTELRDGFGNLPAQGASPAFFTSQRARVNIGYDLSNILYLLKQRQANWAYLMINIKPDFLFTRPVPTTGA